MAQSQTKVKGISKVSPTRIFWDGRVSIEWHSFLRIVCVHCQYLCECMRLLSRSIHWLAVYARVPWFCARLCHSLHCRNCCALGEFHSLVKHLRPPSIVSFIISNWVSVFECHSKVFEFEFVNLNFKSNFAHAFLTFYSPFVSDLVCDEFRLEMVWGITVRLTLRLCTVACDAKPISSIVRGTANLSLVFQLCVSQYGLSLIFGLRGIAFALALPILCSPNH